MMRPRHLRIAGISIAVIAACGPLRSLAGTPVGNAILGLAVLLVFLAVIAGIFCLAGGAAALASFINRTWGQ
jgi:hypothetical protein